MDNLLIDIGNSEIKIGSGSLNNSNVKLLKRFAYSKLSFEKDLEKNFSDLKPSFNKTGISILKDGNKNFLNKFFKNKFKTIPVFIDITKNLPIKINYSRGLGNDRICNAVASVRLFNKKNILVIDFGTATTFTLINDKILKGGMISPGIKTSLDSLIQKTSLPKIELKFPNKVFNDNTIDNLKAGVLFQCLFSVERIIRDEKKNSKNLFVIATGGYSNLISGETTLINCVDPDLVLKGINFIISQ